jgi:hypothetical protein
MGGLWTNGGQPDAQAIADVETQMRAQTAGVNEIWIVLSEVEMWDQRRLMDSWLAQNGEILDQQQFHGAQVAHVRLYTPTSLP